MNKSSNISHIRNLYLFHTIANKIIDKEDKFIMSGYYKIIRLHSINFFYSFLNFSIEYNLTYFYLGGYYESNAT